MIRWSGPIVLRCAVCGLTFSTAAMLAEHEEAHGFGHGLQQSPAILPTPHPDDAPHGEYSVGGISWQHFSLATSSIGNASGTIGLTKEARTYLRTFPIYTDSAFASFTPLSDGTHLTLTTSGAVPLRGPACRVCEQPVESWDGGLTVYCRVCQLTYPEKLDRTGRVLVGYVLRRL